MPPMRRRPGPSAPRSGRSGCISGSLWPWGRRCRRRSRPCWPPRRGSRDERARPAPPRLAAGLPPRPAAVSPLDCRPTPRFLLTRPQWGALAEDLAQEDTTELLGLWADPAMIHAALWAEGALHLVSCPAPDGRYPALSPARPGAVRLERMIHDLWGHVAEGAVDLRPWLDHGRWPNTAPLSTRPGPAPYPVPQPEFLPVEGEGVHQIPVGPVHAAIIEPGHFRFHVQGETV